VPGALPGRHQRQQDRGKPDRGPVDEREGGEPGFKEPPGLTRLPAQHGEIVASVIRFRVVLHDPRRWRYFRGMGSSEKAPKGHPRTVWGEMLTHVRGISGMSREELAARASLSPSTIRAYENGWRSPVRQTVAEQIEPALGSASNGVLLKLWDEFEEAMNYSVFPGWVV